MKTFAKIFLLILIFGVVCSDSEKVFAFELQELRVKNVLPVLPDRLRRRPQRVRRILTPPIINVPRETKPQKTPKYTQRQPKTPPPIHSPKLPPQSIDRRGSGRVKNFGPPRSRYRK